MAALYFMWVNEYISQQCLIDYDSHQHIRLYGKLFYKNYVTILPEMSYDYLLVKKNGIIINRLPLIWVNKIHCIYLNNEIWLPDIKVLGCTVNCFANYYVHLSISPTRSWLYANKEYEAHRPHRLPEKPVQIKEYNWAKLWLHINISWSWPRSSGGEDFKISWMYFCNFFIISLWKKAWPFNMNKLKSFSPRNPIS